MAHRQKRLLPVFHNRRWDSDFLSVKAAIDERRIDRVTHFESHFDRFRPVVIDRWRENAGPGAGIWFDLGPHLVDQVMCLFGPPDTVLANFACQRDGAQSDDSTQVILDYGPCRIVLHAALLVSGGSPRFVVHGDQGSLVKHRGDPQEAQLRAGLRPGSPDWGVDDDDLIHINAIGQKTWIASQQGDQSLYYRAIARALLTGGENPVSPQQSVGVMAVLEAAARSAATGRRLRPGLTRAERSAW